MYKKLPPVKTEISGNSPYPKTTSALAQKSPSVFQKEAVFAGGQFWGLEAAYGSVNGVINTATGYCGGSLNKPSYKDVCEGRTGHTEAVKVIYDIRTVSYGTLCDVFWKTHDPTNKDFLNFGLSTHQRSVIFYSTAEERKQAQESKIKRQMGLNKRIVTKILPLNSHFFMAENYHQKHHLQKHYMLCASLGLRSTQHFMESNLACKLNGIFAMDKDLIMIKLHELMKCNELSDEAKLECESIVEDLRRSGQLSN